MEPFLCFSTHCRSFLFHPSSDTESEYVPDFLKLASQLDNLLWTYIYYLLSLTKQRKTSKQRKQFCGVPACPVNKFHIVPPLEDITFQANSNFVMFHSGNKLTIHIGKFNSIMICFTAHINHLGKRFLQKLKSHKILKMSSTLSPIFFSDVFISTIAKLDRRTWSERWISTCSWASFSSAPHSCHGYNLSDVKAGSNHYPLPVCDIKINSYHRFSFRYAVNGLVTGTYLSFTWQITYVLWIRRSILLNPLLYFLFLLDIFLYIYIFRKIKCNRVKNIASYISNDKSLNYILLSCQSKIMVLDHPSEASFMLSCQP